jgi:choline dehydrogenase
MVEGMKIARHIVDQSPMDQFRDMELAPGADCRTDDDWLEFARRDGQTIYHICGTCRMGTDDKAVTDPQLRVRGIQGLRVVVAEKAADLILDNKVN